jgi:hypothetical protein
LEDAYYTPPDPAISSDGTVYFVRKSNESQREIVKEPLDAPEQVLYTVGAGARLGQLFVDDRAKARHVYFTASEPVLGIHKLVEPLP